MADDDAPPEPTTGQRVHRDIANLGTDATISAAAATPELIAAGLAQLAATSPERPHAMPGSTLDLPASDQVAVAGDLDPGQVIGHFVIRARLGEGGMGVVLAGHDADLGRPVAIKVVKEQATNPAYRARLLREAQVMARLEHPNVVRVYEVGSDRGRLFVAMELVDGVTLGTWLKVERRPWRDVIAMFRQIGAGLAAVHRAGLVHRDFKPENVLVDRDGRARVADFGLARLDPERTTVSPELAASLTRTGMMVGTPAYMAPEQHFGGNVDARADQYSFCVSLREALIGSRPSKLEDAHWGDVPRRLRAVINRGAAVDFEERFPSMDDLLEALAPTRRAAYMAAAAAVVLVGGVIGAVVVMKSASSSSSPAVAAIDETSDADPSRTDPTRVDPSRVELTGVDPSRVDPSRVDASRVDTTRVDPSRVDPSRVDLTGVDPSRVDSTRVAQAPAKAPVIVKLPPKPTTELPARGTGSANQVGARPESSGPTKVGNTVVTPMAPVAATDAAKQHNVDGANRAHEMPAGHRAAVRAALRDHGFLGLTEVSSVTDADLKELEDKAAAASDDLQRGIIVYGMAQAERSRDNCSAAKKHFSEARGLVLPATKDRSNKKRYDTSFLVFGRIRVGEMWCELMSGRALGVGEKLQNALVSMWAASDAERAQVWFAWGIAAYETGEVQHGTQLLKQAARSSVLRPAIETYAQNVGLAL